MFGDTPGVGRLIERTFPESYGERADRVKLLTGVPRNGTAIHAAGKKDAEWHVAFETAFDRRGHKLVKAVCGVFDRTLEQLCRRNDRNIPKAPQSHFFPVVH